jgi:hypothetical protein
MPVIFKSGTNSEAVVSTPFANEAELQKLLSEHPDLLRQPNEPPIAYIASEVNLSDAGSLDLLMVNRDGLPIAVEVKLQRNGESRREVVAQAVDYISALSTRTVDELDETLGGSVESSLRNFDTDADDESLDRRWRALGANLRAGLVRLIVAVDGSNPGLERILRFLAENSELDVQLVVIERFVTSGAQEVIAARPTFSAESVSRSTAPSSNKTPRSELLTAVAEYNSTAPKTLQAVGIAATYRQIRPANWPTKTHYEFYQTGSYIGAELHLESDEAATLLGHTFARLAGSPILGGAKTLLWDQNWNSGRGRLQIKFALNDNPSDVASGMTELVNLTMPLVPLRTAPLPQRVAV